MCNLCSSTSNLHQKYMDCECLMNNCNNGVVSDHTVDLCNWWLCFQIEHAERNGLWNHTQTICYDLAYKVSIHVSVLLKKN